MRGHERGASTARWWTLGAMALGVVACGGESMTDGGSSPDTGTSVDAAGSRDGGTPAVDASTADDATTSFDATSAAEDARIDDAAVALDDAHVDDASTLPDAHVDDAYVDDAATPPDAHIDDAATVDALGGDLASIEVAVLPPAGAPNGFIEVVALHGNLEVARRRTVPDVGIAYFDLPSGSYHFRVVYAGIPYLSGATDHCTTPACTHVDVDVSTRDASYEAIVWDQDPSFVRVTYGIGELAPSVQTLWFRQDGLYVEHWAIADYLRPTAAFTDAHEHIDRSCFDPPFCGNPTYGENQHAFGAIEQGLYIRRDDHGAFDLVSIDYRIRNDTVPEHVSMIPGFDQHTVAILVSTTLGLATPEVDTFTHFPVGTVGTEMSEFRTVEISGFENVTGVYIGSTWNVSFDDIVVRRR